MKDIVESDWSRNVGFPTLDKKICDMTHIYFQNIPFVLNSCNEKFCFIGL